ncbi:MAG: pyrroline-5-carboxylate reductase [Myxococcales bacterium]|nr:pyrroline-5-carboxylate reductase [Myxococcales bacterium]
MTVPGTVGFIGGGAMGAALAGGLLEAGTAPERILIAEPDAVRRAALGDQLSVRTFASAEEIIRESDFIVLAVKPGVIDSVLTGLEDVDAAERALPLWISIAAGVSLSQLESRLPDGARVIRAMPNTPSLVGSGATAFVANQAAGEGDRSAARALFEAVGTVWEAPQESLLDAVTGLSGSGPAYVFVFLEALGDAGVRMGLPRDAAYQLACQTVFGAARLALESGRHPGSLKDQVTSPGGTTIAGLERLEAAGFRAAIHAAVEAATRRSRELGE